MEATCVIVLSPLIILPPSPRYICTGNAKSGGSCTRLTDVEVRVYGYCFEKEPTMSDEKDSKDRSSESRPDSERGSVKADIAAEDVAKLRQDIATQGRDFTVSGSKDASNRFRIDDPQSATNAAERVSVTVPVTDMSNAKRAEIIAELKKLAVTDPEEFARIVKLLEFHQGPDKTRDILKQVKAGVPGFDYSPAGKPVTCTYNGQQIYPVG